MMKMLSDAFSETLAGIESIVKDFRQMKINEDDMAVMIQRHSDAFRESLPTLTDHLAKERDNWRNQALTENDRAESFKIALQKIADATESARDEITTMGCVYGIASDALRIEESRS